MVFFGTGKYLEPGDDVNSATTPFMQQSFYGIWDQQTKTNAGSIVSGRSVLMPQAVYCSGTLGTGQAFVDPTKTCSISVTGTTNLFRLTTAHQPNYGTVNRSDTIVDPNVLASSPGPLAAGTFVVTPERGWYMDFPNAADTLGPWSSTGTGERVKDRPFLSTGKLVFATLIPSNIACELGGSGFVFDLDPLTGSRLGTSPIGRERRRPAERGRPAHTCDEHHRGQRVDESHGRNSDGPDRHRRHDRGRRQLQQQLQQQQLQQQLEHQQLQHQQLEQQLEQQLQQQQLEQRRQHLDHRVRRGMRDEGDQHLVRPGDYNPRARRLHRSRKTLVARADPGLKGDSRCVNSGMQARGRRGSRSSS